MAGARRERVVSGHTLAQLRELISHSCALESSLAAAAGYEARSGGGSLPAALSAHAAWRLDLWQERWPTPEQSGGQPLVFDGPAPSADLGSLLLQLLALYRGAEGRIDVDLDGPTARVLELVTGDVERDLGRLSTRS